MRARGQLICLLLCGSGVVSAYAMELVWSRGTGQYRCEATPARIDIDRDGQQELLAVNLGGQLMLWNLDGTAKGDGHDGTVAELPKGEWSAMPLVMYTGAGVRVVLGNTDGLLVCLDASFSTRWTHQLAGKTQWARAVPSLLPTASDPLLVIGDLSGTVTCLTRDGAVAWTREFRNSPIRTYTTAFSTRSGVMLLVAAGDSVHCLGATGALQWSHNMGGELLAKPETMAIDSELRIVCANSRGDIVALDADGAEQWRTQTGGEIDASIVHWEDDTARPLIACTGLWGDAIALDTGGKLAWRHIFRSKNRAQPLVADTDGDGKTELIVAAYNQHVYAFDREGRCVDDVRVTGSVTASPIAVPNAHGGNDIVVVSSTLQAHRFAPAKSHAIYGAGTKRRGRVFVESPADKNNALGDAIVLDNPSGRFVRVNVSATTDAGESTFSRLSSADTIVLPVPGALRECPAFAIEVSDPDGSELLRKKVRIRSDHEIVAQDRTPRIWPTPAYAPLDARAEAEATTDKGIRIGPVYRGEIDQGAFVIQNAQAVPLDAQIEFAPPSRANGAAFAGSIALFKLAAVPTLNGEQVLDALVPVKDQHISVPANDSAKLWIQIDSHGAEPGAYRSQLRVRSADNNWSDELSIAIDVDGLALPQQTLTLCTWDYVPNNWFPGNTASVLDDMQRHGVDVFPRGGLPKARYDGKRLTFDWSNLDEELARIEGRGTLLLQVSVPSIDFGGNAPADPRPVHITYLRALRDHLFEKGWGYDAWALYPVDEPGLDYGGNAQRFFEAGQLFREADPRMRIYTDPVPGLSQRDYDRIAPFVDVWCPNMRLVTGLLANDARMTAIRASGKPVWSYECVSQVRSLSPLRYNRANAWRADYFGLDGIGFWTHSRTQVDPWIADTTKNDEYALVYPGPTPVSSVRWEAVRDGIEDAGAVRLLGDALRKARTSRPAAKAIASAEDVLQRARVGVMEMADEAYVESRDFLRQGNREIQHTWWDAQAFLRYRKEIAEATHALDEADSPQP